MLSFLERLRDRFRSRKTDGETAYWRALERAAGEGEPSAKAIDAIESLARAIGRSADAVAHDLELLTDLDALGDVDTETRNMAVEARKLRSDSATKEKAAEDLERQARELRKQSSEALDLAHSISEDAVRKREEAARIRGELAAVGRPGDVEASGRAQVQREIESLQSELVGRKNGTRVLPLADSEIRSRLAELGVPVVDEEPQPTGRPLPPEAVKLNRLLVGASEDNDGN